MGDETETFASQKPAQSHRLHSLDFYRGVALIFILIDHLEMVTGHLVLSTFTLRRIGLADGLDTFVFISGVVFGLVHRRVQESSFIRSQWKAIRRIGVLLAANWITFAFVLLLALFFRTNYFALNILRIDQAVSHPIAALSGVATMMFQPFGFDILPLYVGILIIAPMILWASERNLLGGLSVSIGLYAMALTIPAASLVTSDSIPWSFQPLGWQLVFTMGMLSLRIPLKEQHFSVRVLLAASTLLAFLTLSNFAWDLNTYCRAQNSAWLVGHSIPGPLRILHFILLAASITLLHSFWKYERQIVFVHWLVQIGRSPLPVFLFGLCFAYVAALTCTGLTSLEILLVEFNGILLSFFVAVLYHRLTTPPCKPTNPTSVK